jgi:hypothetical protein
MYLLFAALDPLFLRQTKTNPNLADTMSISISITTKEVIAKQLHQQKTLVVKFATLGHSISSGVKIISLIGHA